jgi:very-short-patch-repair endonuclease
MERKVLDWTTKTPFYQRNEDRLELFAQFPIGDYLRQLDPTYQHPPYRCDFLLCYRGNDQPINVILEYDGFQEHFTDHKKIHLGNYDAYYRPEDIERQMVLESYGYKFLRINRFNLGNDPVATLSDRLYALIDAATKERDAQVVTKIRNDASGLKEGTTKHCRKCDQVKPKESFFDPKLRGGQGNYGQICMECKTRGSQSAETVSPKKRIRRYWKRR